MLTKHVMSWLVKTIRDNRDYDLNIAALYCAGLWPPASNAKPTLLDKCLKLSTYFVLLSALVSTFTLPLQAIYTDDVVELFKTIGFVFVEAMAFVKGGCFYFRADRFKRLTSSIRRWSIQDESASRSREKQRIAASTQAWTNLFFCVTTSSVLLFYLMYISQIPHMVAYRRFWFPVDLYQSPTFEIMTAYSAIRTFLSVPMTMFADGFLGTTMLQGIGQLRLLRRDLLRMKEDATTTVTMRWVREKRHEWERRCCLTPSSERALEVLSVQRVAAFEKEVGKEMHRRLVRCVDHYRKCMRLVREVEATVGPILIYQLVSTVATLVAGISFLASAMRSKDVDVQGKDMFASTSMVETLLVALLLVMFNVVELGVTCYLADILTEQSDLVRNAVYFCDWFDQSESFKRSMRVIMARSNQPLHVTAAKFVPLSRETFLAILNLAYSYYMGMTTALKKAQKV